MKKRIIATIAAICMVLTLLPALALPALAVDMNCDNCTNIGTFNDGGGTSGDPWIITTP